ncbi:MAG: NRDE family protein [Planctomycetaceae bacterium]|nr:NRDE family protein [Planctomycetaceae bacterium]
MCTVTALSERADNGERWVRVACNRDELRTRPVALPPQRRQFSDCVAIFPMDPVSGGTWIAVTSAGLGFTVLNLYDASRPNCCGPRSRGLIIPSLLSAKTLNAAVDRIARLDATQFAPFRLVLLNDCELVEFASIGTAVERTIRSNLSSPTFFTSSGLGDHLVDGPRREVFRQLLGNDYPTRQQQDDLHRHSWADRPHVSICMQRSDARTVSYTTFEITPKRVRLDYYAGAPGEDAETWSLCDFRKSPRVRRESCAT